MSRITSFKDIRDKEDDDDDKKQNKLFAGGLDQRGGGSGVNVIGPPTSSDPNLFSQIQRNATQSGALHEGSGEPSSRRITIYRNGFTVDDGPLRDPHAPDNVQFIRDLGNGVVPAELGSSEDTEVDLVDKHGEDYVAPPPPSYVAFSGAGMSLGAATVDSNSFILDPDVLSTLPETPDPVDESKPITTIQVRTLTGQRLKIKINQSATILQLAVAIKSQFTTSDSYVLTAGYPPTDLCDPEQTVLEAGLINALVTMKKV